jgi:hypothetical protein
METKPPFDTSSEPTMVAGRAVEPSPPLSPPPLPPEPAQPIQPPAPAKGGGNKTLIIVVVVLLVLCCCCAVIAAVALWPAVQEQIQGISSLPMPFLPLV